MMSKIEVDQSGRMEVLTEDTALGFSNGYQASILTIGASFRDNFGPKLVKVPTLCRNWTSAQSGIQQIQDFIEYYSSESQI